MWIYLDIAGAGMILPTNDNCFFFGLWCLCDPDSIFKFFDGVTGSLTTPFFLVWIFFPHRPCSMISSLLLQRSSFRCSLWNLQVYDIQGVIYQAPNLKKFFKRYLLNCHFKPQHILHPKDAPWNMIGTGLGRFASASMTEWWLWKRLVNHFSILRPQNLSIRIFPNQAFLRFHISQINVSRLRFLSISSSLVLIFQSQGDGFHYLSNIVFSFLYRRATVRASGDVKEETWDSGRVLGISSCSWAWKIEVDTLFSLLPRENICVKRQVNMKLVYYSG